MGRIAMTDDEFISAFEDCKLEPFHHADHVRVAFLYLARYPALAAMQKFSSALVRFATAKGKPGLYNETITWALMLLIRERMARGPQGQEWSEFAEGNPDLMSWPNNVLRQYYREETLKSDLAKRTFLFPDRCGRE